MSERVTVAKEAGVADVRLNRPEKLNALDLAMFQALVETGKQLAADRSLRVVVLSGEGRAFCAGLDFASFLSLPQDGSSPSLFDREPGNLANLAQGAAAVWTELAVPVIAAVHGFAYGGGLQIALGADIRFVEPTAKLSVMEIKYGLIPDMTGSQTLRRLVRLDVAKELTFTGRVLLGTEAVALGLATHTSEKPLDDAMALAHEIASKSPDAIRAGKQLFNQAGVVGPAEGLRLEELLQRSLLGSASQLEAVQAAMEKRQARFKG